MISPRVKRYYKYRAAMRGRRRRAWTPALLPSIAAWWRADQGVYTDAGATTPATALGDLVYTWRAIVGGLDIVQSTADNRPPLKPSGFNGRPCLSTDSGGTRKMTLPAGLALDSRDFSLFVVARFAACGVFARALIEVGSSFEILLETTDFTTGSNMFHLESFLAEENHTGLIPYTAPLLHGMIGRSASRVAVLGALSHSASAFDSATPSGGTLFTRHDNDNFNWRGEIYEVIAVDGDTSAADLASLRAYVASRYCPTTFTKQVVCLGDSITEGLDSTISRGWPVVMSDALGASWKVWNTGRSGYTADSIRSTDAPVLALFEAGYAKNVAVVLAGTNDIGIDAQTGAQTITRIQSLCTDLQGAGYYVIVCTILPRNDAGWDATKETHRGTVNTYIVDDIVNDLYADAVVDLAVDADLDDPDDTNFYDADKLHPIDAGHSRIATLIRAAVEAA